MTPTEFKAWRVEVGFTTQQEVADALGISKATVENYEAGRRRDTGQPVDIPVYISLACQALRTARGNAHSSDARVEQWHRAAKRKYVAEASQWLGDREVAENHFQLTYGVIRPDGQEIDHGRLINVLREANDEVRDLVATGWSMFYVFSRQGIEPRMVVDADSGQGETDFVECSLLRGSATDASDLWRLSGDGLATLLRGYFEDRPDTAAHLGATPRSFISPNWMVRDVAEFVRHARAVASRFRDASAIAFRCEWSGLEGRVISDPTALWHPGMYRFDSDAGNRVATGTWPVIDLKEKWPTVVAKLVAPVMRAAGCDRVVTAEWVKGQEQRWRRFG